MCSYVRWWSARRTETCSIIDTSSKKLFSLSDKPYVHWNVNTINTSPTCFDTSLCHHVGALVSVKVVSFEVVRIVGHRHSLTNWIKTTRICVSEWATVPHTADQFEGHNFNWCKDSLMMSQRSAESCRRLCVSCVHISVHVRFDQWSFASVLYNITIKGKVIPLRARCGPEGG